MVVNINITKKEYEFIDGATGEKISAEEFAKRYPAVGIARSAVGDGVQAGNTEAEGKEKQ